MDEHGRGRQVEPDVGAGAGGHMHQEYFTFATFRTKLEHYVNLFKRRPGHSAMDKRHFVDKAPVYYALAIPVHFRSNGGVAYRHEIEDDFTIRIDENGYQALLTKQIVFEKAIEWLEELGAIEPLLDDFGPPIYRRTEEVHDIWNTLAQNRELPFYKYASVRDERNWLNSALSNLNEQYDFPEMSDDDFEDPDSEWQPLPLDRADEQLRIATESIDEVIRQVRSDNGYNATLPEESGYVLSTLRAASQSLKESTTTSLGYLRKYAFEPLAILIQRFRGAAIAVAATAAKDALIDFLKEHGVKLLDAIFKYPLTHAAPR
jgi:hypothetical protein